MFAMLLTVASVMVIAGIPAILICLCIPKGSDDDNL